MGFFTGAVASVKALAAPRHKYRAVPELVTDRRFAEQLSLHPHPPLPPRSRIFNLSMGAMLLTVFIFLGLAFARDRSSSQECEVRGQCQEDISRHWGQYSPYFSAPAGSKDPDVPDECKIVFASVLSRHGSRFPTKHKSQTYKSLVERIQKDVKSYGKGFGFIKKYRYQLGANDLTPYGEEELVRSGKKFYKRYAKLIKGAKDPFVRAAGSDRVILSAKRFLQGFARAKGEKHADKYISGILVLPEGPKYNNTLDHGTCSAFEAGRQKHKHKRGGSAKGVWKNKWATPIMNRLNTKLPGAKLSLDETIHFMDLCPFNTVNTKKAKPSEFCRLFSEDEWRGYGYYESLDKWYSYGPGQLLGPTQGVGYVNELIARLTKSPVKDHTSTNKTLDSNPATFPLDRSVYADFSHDNTMLTIYGALGLYTNTTELPGDHRKSPQAVDGFSSSWTVPFGARMYVEKMVCGKDKKELVRVLVNDRVVAPKGCKADDLGRCELNDFLKGLEFAMKGGLWDLCGR